MICELRRLALRTLVCDGDGTVWRLGLLNDCRARLDEADAIAEATPNTLDPSVRPVGSRCEQYKRLWESIRGVGSWAVNPCVWVISFRRVKP